MSFQPRDKSCSVYEPPSRWYILCELLPGAILADNFNLELAVVFYAVASLCNGCIEAKSRHTVFDVRHCPHKKEHAPAI